MSEVLRLVEFQMCLLLFVALSGSLLASRLGQSAVVGEILLGVLVGPSLLGLVTYTDFVAGLAQLGAVFLLFVIGTEFRLQDVARPRYLLIGTCGVLMPFGMGWLAADLLGFPFGSAMFVAAALTATSVAITAGVLKELGKLHTAAARAIIGAAVIDDVLGLLALAATRGVVAGSVTAAGVALALAKAVLFLASGGLAGRFLLVPLLGRLDRTSFTRRFREAPFLFAVTCAFLYAAAAELVGLSAIVGAFMAGASLGGVRLRHGKDLHAGFESLKDIFSAIFFVSLGVLTDVRAADPRVLVLLGVLLAVAFASKLAGCGGAALLTGSSLKDATIIGLGMVPRGEVAMIVALTGLNSGRIGQGVYVTIILLGLLTTVATPLVLRPLLGPSRAAPPAVPAPRS